MGCLREGGADGGEKEEEDKASTPAGGVESLWRLWGLPPPETGTRKQSQAEETGQSGKDRGHANILKAWKTLKKIMDRCGRTLEHEESQHICTIREKAMDRFWKTLEKL